MYDPNNPNREQQESGRPPEDSSHMESMESMESTEPMESPAARALPPEEDVYWVPEEEPYAEPVPLPYGGGVYRETGGYWAAKPAERSISYGDVPSPYGAYANPASGYREPEPPKPHKKNSILPMLALCLCFTLVGGVIGGAIGIGLLTPPQEMTEQAGDDTAAPALADSSTLPVAAHIGTALTANQIFEKCNDSVVAISTETTSRNVFGRNATQASAGSGFIISSDGYIVTNNHVIDGASSVRVLLADGTSHKATVIGHDADTDVAVLKIDATGLTPLTWGDSKALKVGDPAVAIGNPLGELANTMTSGIISALDRVIDIDGTPRSMLQTDASISPGNSGGPLINEYGEVVGIVTAKSSGSGVEGLGFAIPSYEVKTVVEELIANGYVSGRPQLGISVRLMDEDMAGYYSIEPGLYIVEVNAGSCAEKAGLQKGDIITSFNGVQIDSAESLNAEKNKCKAGDTVTVAVTRNGQTLSLQVVLDEKQPEAEQPVQDMFPSNLWPGGDDGM